MKLKHSKNIGQVSNSNPYFIYLLKNDQLNYYFTHYTILYCFVNIDCIYPCQSMSRHGTMFVKVPKFNDDTLFTGTV